MKIKLYIAALSVILLSILYLSGPRVDLRYEIKPVNLPSNISQHLESTENRFLDIKRGTEKKVIWANPTTREATSIAIVYLHGFSASRQEVAPLCDELAKRLSANLYYTRLTGHGRGGDAMKLVTVDTLLNDAYEALEIGKRIGNKVILVGTSTGGSLAAWLASQQKNSSVAAMILLSPNFGLKRKESELILQPWGQTLLNLIEGEEYQFSPVNEQQEMFWTTRYPTYALLGMMGLVDITRKLNFTKITIPTLILYSNKDKIVDIEAIKSRYQQLGSTTKETYVVEGVSDPQQHILAGNILSPKTTAKVLNRIESFLKQVIN